MTLVILSILIIIHIFFYLALKQNKFALMDVCWGLGIVLVALVSFIQHISTKPKILLLLMVSAWGLRLSYHIWNRIKNQHEDFRYAQLKKDWGADYKRQGYFKVFLMQGFLMFIVSLPVQVGMSGLWESFDLKKYFGFMLWTCGFALEVYSDEYLKRFKLTNKNEICMSGPWKYCRFPNFLGEMVMWWGIYFFVFSFWSSWTIIGPITLTYFMVNVTGVPMLEEKFKARPEYREYMKTVPRFIPFDFEKIKNLIPRKRQD